MRRNIVVRCALFMLCGYGLLCLQLSVANAANDEFNRVRRIYIEGARFMQEKRYNDAVPMLGQAYNMLSRAVKEGSKNQRTLRALRKLRYFLGFSLYQVGDAKAKGTSKEDKAFTREHFGKAVPLLTRYAKEGKSLKRRNKAAKLLVLANAWLKQNPKPIARVKPKIILVGPPPKGRLRAWPFIILGVGVATAIAGAVTAGITLATVGQRDEVHSTLSASQEPSSGEVARLHQQAGTLATTSYILWGVGGGITVAGIILAAAVGRAPPPKTPPPNNTPSRSNANNTALLWQGAPQ